MPRGKKQCPVCNSFVGPRAFNCSCGHEFMPGKAKKTQPINKGVGRGRKQCPSCSALVGPRSHVCPHCQHEFKPGAKKDSTPTINVKKKFKRLVDDWKSLEKGSRIKVVKGSGDYYLNEDGERVYMQDPGVYTVQNVNTDGLVVHGKRGHGFIYMGDPKPSPVLKSVHKEPAKLVLLKA